MVRNWTFGQKVGAGFAVTVVMAVMIGAVAVYALRNVVAGKDKLLSVNAPMIVEAEHLSSVVAQKNAAAVRFLLTKEDKHLDDMREHHSESQASIAHLRAQAETEDERRLIGEIEKSDTVLQTALDRLVALRRTDATIEAITRVFDDEVFPKRQELRQAVDAFTGKEAQILGDAKQESTRSALAAVNLVVGIAICAVLFAIAVAIILTRTLGRQIGTAVGHVQSSSAELQSAANQQATGAKEQATAMNEITTTISELLATSRQIAESAQRVAHIADETAGSARSGQGTVEKAHESIAGIRRQVDIVVNHMLDLGKKSQQIGSVLDIVSELAEQTNILSINATIEAAGAGEAGKRFSVVADEIRKLADRVAVSTKEIRCLIEDVRGAVNTTVMATEGGSKAVDAGTRQFGEVATSFTRIAGLVSTTTEAAREIELSTKQQTTAVEQVNVAIANVAQATRETEASASQTLQTASQLAGLSRELTRLIQVVA